MIITPPKPSLETNLHAKWSKTRGLYQSDATKIHNRRKSPDFQTNSTLNPFDFISRNSLNPARLWLECHCLQQYYMRNGQKHGVYTWIMKQKYIMQTQFDFAGDFFAQNHSTFRQGIPLRLWFDFQTRSTLAAGCRPAHPVRSVFWPGGYAPQDGPSWAKCAFCVHISLNCYLANIKLTLQRVLNFGSS